MSNLPDPLTLKLDRWRSTGEDVVLIHRHHADGRTVTAGVLPLADNTAYEFAQQLADLLDEWSAR